MGLFYLYFLLCSLYNSHVARQKRGFGTRVNKSKSIVYNIISFDKLDPSKRTCGKFLELSNNKQIEPEIRFLSTWKFRVGQTRVMEYEK